MYSLHYIHVVHCHTDEVINPLSHSCCVFAQSVVTLVMLIVIHVSMVTCLVLSLPISLNGGHYMFLCVSPTYCSHACMIKISLSLSLSLSLPHTGGLEDDKHPIVTIPDVGLKQLDSDECFDELSVTLLYIKTLLR